MIRGADKNVLMWLLVALCMAGIVLIWLPSFFDTIWGFSEDLGKKSNGASGAFMQNLKEIQKEFEYALDEQQKTDKKQQEAQLQQVAPLDEQSLQDITKQLEEFKDTSEKSNQELLTPKAYCTRKGGVYTERSGISGSLYGVCSFTDGSECHALLFSKEKCHVGQYTKAEDGIPKWPDLALSVDSIEYCRRLDGVLTAVPRERARGVCIKGITVINNGIAASMPTQLDIDGKRYSIRALQVQEKQTLTQTIILQKTPDLASIVLRADADNILQEIDKKNNTYQYVQK